MNGVSGADSAHPNAAPSTSRVLYDQQEPTTSVDEAVTSLLSSLRFESKRRFAPTDEDDEQLRAIHEKISAVVERERDETRRRRLRHACPCSHTVREQVIYLRRLHCDPSRSRVPAASYFPRLTHSLTSIVTNSFDEEYRKAAILLGIVEAVAELLVLEVCVFGVGGPAIPHSAEHRNVRKLVANALTNLTYGNVASKQKLCRHDGLVQAVVALLLHSTNLAQVYAGLIRNLSWMADAEMISILSPSCPALAHAFVEAHKIGHDPGVSSTLSALWNLASHSTENKRSICEFPNCLSSLAALLVPDSRKTVVVESASGVLKYASQYLTASPHHAPIRAALVSALLRVLNSSSFTVVASSLSAIDALIAKDPQLQAALRCNGPAFSHLNVLRNSAREDIRAIVKKVLNHLNDSMYYRTPYGNEMTASLGCESTSSRVADASRLLPRRSPRASPGALLLNNGLQQRSCSLPRHFTRGGGPTTTASTMHSSDASRQMFCPSASSHHPSHFSQDSQESGVVVLEDEELSESRIATCTGSMQSLASMFPDGNSSIGWQSAVETADNSGRLSPVSPSELPDSPTQCAQMPQFVSHCQQLQPESASTPLRVSVGGSRTNRVGSGASGASGSGASRVASDATSVPDEEPTPTFAAPTTSRHHSQSTDDEALPGPEEEGDYGGFDLADGDLLEQSIQAALPPLRTVDNVLPPVSESDRLLNEAIEAALPVRTGAGKATSSDDALLQSAILSAMPVASPAHSPFHPKNAAGGRGIRGRPRPQDDLFKAMNRSTLMPESENGERIRDASRLRRVFDASASHRRESTDEAESSGSETFPAHDESEVVGDLPLDVLDETDGEREDGSIDIDCGPLSARAVPSTPSGSAPVRPAPSRAVRSSGLRQPSAKAPRRPPLGTTPRKTAAVFAPSSPTVAPPIETPPTQTLPFPSAQQAAVRPARTSVAVPPYNYQKPTAVSEEETTKENEVEQNVVLLERREEKGKPFGGQRERRKEEKVDEVGREVRPNSKQMLVTTV